MLERARPVTHARYARALRRTLTLSAALARRLRSPFQLLRGVEHRVAILRGRRRRLRTQLGRDRGIGEGTLGFGNLGFDLAEDLLDLRLLLGTERVEGDRGLGDGRRFRGGIPRLHPVEFESSELPELGRRRGDLTRHRLGPATEMFREKRLDHRVEGVVVLGLGETMPFVGEHERR